MRIILSPAKKMRVDIDSLPYEGLPVCLEQTEQIVDTLKKMNREELKTLWKCNDAITDLNVQRLQDMDLYHNLTPAVLSYVGIQYQYMAPGVFTQAAYDYLQTHLRILSGFYGILRPFDGVTPYRLEMQAKLPVDGTKDLYTFWADTLANHLLAETDLILNLASKEYSQCISRFLPSYKTMITCVFGELQGDKVVEKGTLCKMARGEMVRYLAEYQVGRIEGVKEFCGLDYHYEPRYSDEKTFTFLRKPTRNTQNLDLI